MPDARALVAVVSDAPRPRIVIGDRVVWGVPVDEGPAENRVLEDLADRPARARDLLGVYVIVVIDRTSVRLISSAALPQTLLRVEGPTGSAFATRSILAHVLAGQTPRISDTAVPEFVVFDFPVATEEVLANTVVLEEASTVELTTDAIHCNSYWPADERMASGPPTTSHRLQSVLGDVVRRLARVPDAHLALTAGRDSRLILGCMHEVGAPIPSFTLGSSRDPDVAGAIAATSRLRWQHEAVRIGTRTPANRFAEVVRWAPWHEGTQRAWDYAASWFDWERHDGFYLGGHGGEIGRAFYGPVVDGSLEKAIDALAGRARRLSRQAQQVIRERIRIELERLAAFGRRPEDLLALFYAKYRAHRFFVRFAPFPQFRAYGTPYLEAPVVRALLDIPVEHRDGRVFDEALGSMRRPVTDKPLRAPTRQSIGRSLHRRFQRLRYRLTDSSWHHLRATLSDAGELPVATSVLGDEWWSQSVRSARAGEGFSFWRLWNALSVEALAAYLRDEAAGFKAQR